MKHKTHRQTGNIFHCPHPFWGIGGASESSLLSDGGTTVALPLLASAANWYTINKQSRHSCTIRRQQFISSSLTNSVLRLKIVSQEFLCEDARKSGHHMIAALVEGHQNCLSQKELLFTSAVTALVYEKLNYIPVIFQKSLILMLFFVFVFNSNHLNMN